ncbi:RNA polymerase sigma factor SigZ [Vibrio thalassae]|uniref:RNA polymerase sigma factor SigZ n=2 Tax=Vibrio thalassae TaxID=1243014 RepID=A0A240ELK7_9VIBR|nr:RNA polymerase sigma factor SigZ [Vibrio thalassae]
MTQLQTCLPRILPKLSDDDRHIIEMCDLNGLPQLDYAQKYGLTLAATKA